MLKNKNIPSKESTQFLGMTLDSRLNWVEYINKFRAKAKKALNTIRVVAWKKWKVQYAGQRLTIATIYIIQLL